MNKIIMQREYQGQDSWGAFKEQVIIDDDNNLNYRATEGGNGEFGDWEEYVGEQAAITFIFGNFPVSKKTIDSFKEDCLNFKGIEDNEFNLDGY